MANPLKARWRRWFDRKKVRAAQAVDSPTELERTANQAIAKAEKATRSPTVGRLRQAWADVQVLVRLTRAYARGEYREVSKGTIVLVAGALVYFVSPIDAIFDHLPLAGLLDDAAVLAWVVSEVRAEIEAFRVWEATARTPALSPAPPSESPAA